MLPQKLTGEQKRILNLPLHGPVLIKGVAGSGKTTIAIYRALHLEMADKDLFNSTNICIFTYTKSLIKYIRSSLLEKESKLTVSTLHKWAYDFLRQNNYWNSHQVNANTADKYILEAVHQLKQHYPNRAILEKKIDFYKNEVSWMKGRMFSKKSDYLDTKRVGRGKTDRVTMHDKELLWDIFEMYCTNMQQANLVDFDDYSNLAITYIDNNQNFITPFSHIVVDEAQDLSMSQLHLISKLVHKNTNSITIIADIAQQIYNKGFTWSDVGLNIRGGRSVELKRNYRNTRQIAEAATSLLLHDSQKSEFTEHTFSVQNGELPIVISACSNQCQFNLLLRYLQKVDLANESVVVLHRNSVDISGLCSKLRNFGFNADNIISESTSKIDRKGLYVCTMHSVKGLEFDHVIILELNEGIIPHPNGFEDENDEQHIITERRLLYMCMTRAKKKLLIMHNLTNPSRYLAEIDHKLVRSFIKTGE